MLNISEETKIAFLSDSKPKELIINNEFDSINDINFYCGDIVNETIYTEVNLNIGVGESKYLATNSEPYISNFDTVACKNAYHGKDYVCLSFYLKFDTFRTTAPSQFALNVSTYINESRTERTNHTQTYSMSDYNNQWGRVSWIIPTQDFYGFVDANIDCIGSRLNCKMQIKQYQIEYADNQADLPRQYNSKQSNIYFDFDTYNLLPINNDNIEYESFSLTESLCSQDNIKFGLCESANCTFTVVGKNNNFNDQIIRPVISVNREITDEDIAKINFAYDQSHNYHAGDTWTETRHINSTWYMPTSQWLIYTDIASYDSYFADKVYTQLELKFNSATFDIQPKYIMLALYVEYENASSVFIRSNNLIDIDNFDDFTKLSFEFDYNTENGKITQVTRPYFLFYDENGRTVNVTADINYSLKNIQVLSRLINNTYPEYSVDDCMIENGTLEDYINSLTGEIPLGVFAVKDVKTSYTRNLLKKQITAYDRLINLEQNAGDWYTSYMFGFNTTSSPSGTEPETGLMWTRQIYSSFFDIATEFNIDNRNNYTETVIIPETKLNNNGYINLVNMYSTWQSDNGSRIRYAKFTINNPQPTKRYVVDFPDNMGIFNNSWYGEYFWGVDKLIRGLMSANICIEETRPDHSVNRFLVDTGDYFMISPDCTKIDIYVPSCTYRNGANDTQLFDTIKVSRVEEPIKLTNGHIPLMYYNLATKEIFACDTSITGRDVVRSLLEPCGCFFRLSRKNGIPEFVYCTRYGLYPSNTLYPADDLYPRETVDGELVSMGRYMSLVSDDYRVKNYGQIQILRQDNSNDVKTVCEWQYTGSNEVNVYVIDDNIFYCNSKMYYDQQNMPQVQEMLENMFTAINNMGYVPNQVQALGMPWVECGDRIGLLTLNSGVDSFIFRRTLSGIQMLVDHYEAVGDEYNNQVYGFKYLNKYL